jgi:hypothetical protein
MRERTTWNRNKIAADLKKVAEDPRSMNQDHLEQQPAADKYLIGDGSPSQFAEDVHSDSNNWKTDLGADGNTLRNEIGMPEMRNDTFNHSEYSPGETPKRAFLNPAMIEKRAEVTTKIARLMLKGASENVIEDQAFSLMDMSDSSLNDMYTRLAQQQGDDEEDEEDEDQGQQGKQAQQQQQNQQEEGEG